MCKTVINAGISMFIIIIIGFFSTLGADGDGAAQIFAAIRLGHQLSACGAGSDATIGEGASNGGLSESTGGRGHTVATDSSWR